MEEKDVNISGELKELNKRLEVKEKPNGYYEYTGYVEDREPVGKILESLNERHRNFKRKCLHEGRLLESDFPPVHQVGPKIKTWSGALNVAKEYADRSLEWWNILIRDLEDWGYPVYEIKKALVAIPVEGSDEK
jgi:hypothetical protein